MALQVPAPTELAVHARAVPSHIYCGVPFTVKCTVTNASKQPMELFLAYDPKVGCAIDHHHH